MTPAWAAAVLFFLGVFGLLGLLLSVGGELLARRTVRRRWTTVAGWRPIRMEEQALLGAAVGAVGALGLVALGVGGVWPFWLISVGAGAGFGLGFYRRLVAQRAEEGSLLLVLEDLALRLQAEGGVEPALRAVARVEDRSPARRALRQALARRGLEGGPAVLRAWAESFRPDLLGPIVAAVQAAQEAGLDPAAALRETAETAAREMLARQTARLKALPDALLPFLGLGLFAPILGLLMIPLLVHIIQRIAETTRFRVP